MQKQPLAVETPHAAVMWTLKQLADRDGISKQAVSKRARRFADEHGLVVERDAQGRILKLNVVQFDQLRGNFADPSKDQTPKPKAERKQPNSKSREEAQRQQAWTDAERSKLELDEVKGRLIGVEAVCEAVLSAGDVVTGIVDRLPNAADALGEAFAKDGMHGLRVGLTREAHRMRGEIAKALTAAQPPVPPEDEEAPEDAAPEAL